MSEKYEKLARELAMQTCDAARIQPKILRALELAALDRAIEEMEELPGAVAITLRVAELRAKREELEKQQ